MDGLNIVELGNVCEETRGTLIFGAPDSGGLHYFWPVSAVRKVSDVKPASDDKAGRIVRTLGSIG
jgi:hypothetical protein